jgi:hypothetical protein
MSYFSTVKIDTNAVSGDAFSRLRVSSPEPVADASFEYDLQPLIFGQVTNGTGASISHDTTNRTATFAFSSTATGGKAHIQTYDFWRYQPGRSHLVLLTFNFGTAVADCLKFVGYSDRNNGIELQQNGTAGVRLALYSDTAKGDEFVNQADWNIDPMDGTGPSGITVDWTMTQIFVISGQWLGHGRQVCALDIDGELFPVHAFLHANLIAVPYAQTWNLPVRFGMECSGTVTASMFATCFSVISEGGQPDPPGFTFSVEGTGTAGNGARAHVLSIRPTTVFPAASALVNRTRFVLDSIDLMVTGNSPVYWELVLGQAISGTTAFTAVNATYSAAEYNTAGTISGSPALVIASGYVAASAQTKTAVSKSLLARYPITLDAAGAVRAMGTLSVIATGIGAASACRATLTWRGIR